MTAKQGSFSQHLPAIASAASRKSIFLYVDPYTVKGLIYDEMRAVYERVRQASSIEVLLNLNSATFVRWALAAMSRMEHCIEDNSPQDLLEVEDLYDSAEPDELTKIAGGDYWKDIVRDRAKSFADQVEEFTDRYCQLMHNHFDYVCWFPIKEKYKHQIPKYFLIYATRHIDGLTLMNDAMCKARRAFLESEFADDRIFDVTPPEELFDPNELNQSVLAFVSAEPQPVTRKRIRQAMIENWFCLVESKEINQSVGRLLQEKQLFAQTGRTRINDMVLLSIEPFESSK